MGLLNSAALLFAALLTTRSSVLTTRARDALIGWEGDTYNKNAVFGDTKKPDAAAPERWVETVSWTPRAFVFHNFLTDEESNHILHTAAIEMRRSTVVAGNSSAVDQIRTSYGMFLPRLRDPIIFRVEQKLANWTQLPVVYQEDIQVLRYQQNQKYGAHYDALNRVCTVLIFLTDTDAGGETAFPKTTDAHWADASQKQNAEAAGPLSKCASGHVAVRPRKGSALLFYSMKPNGIDTDDLAMHTGCPITEEWARKWTATIWIHGKPFRPDDMKDTRLDPPPLFDAGICTNLHEKCEAWARNGECEHNPGYMLGEDGHGQCRAACKACKHCPPGDYECYRKNRTDDGYINLEDEILQLTGRPLDKAVW